jgi:outer membrane protein TolC
MLIGCKQIGSFGLLAILASLLVVVMGGCTGPLDENPRDSLGVPELGAKVGVPAEPQPPQAPEPVDGPLRLQACIDLALKHNPAVGASAAAGQAAAETELAQAQAWPKIDFVPGSRHSLNNQRLTPARRNGEPGAFTQDVISGELVLTMPLVTGGQLTHQIKTSELL